MAKDNLGYLEEAEPASRWLVIFDPAEEDNKWPYLVIDLDECVVVERWKLFTQARSAAANLYVRAKLGNT